LPSGWCPLDEVAVETQYGLDVVVVEETEIAVHNHKGGSTRPLNEGGGEPD